MNDLEKNNMSTTNTHIQTFKIKKINKLRI